MPDIELAVDPTDLAAPAGQLHQRTRSDAGAVHAVGRPEPEHPVSDAAPTARSIERFWVTLYERDFDGVGAFFADDGEYTDMPTPPEDVARGPAQIAARLRLGLEPLASLSHTVKTIIVDGDTVATEHVEHWEWPTGEKISFPFVSMHEIRDGKLDPLVGLLGPQHAHERRARLVGRAHHDRVRQGRPARDAGLTIGPLRTTLSRRRSRRSAGISRRRGADHDRDLLVVGERDLARVAGVRLRRSRTPRSSTSGVQ